MVIVQTGSRSLLLLPHQHRKIARHGMRCNVGCAGGCKPLSWKTTRTSRYEQPEHRPSRYWTITVTKLATISGITKDVEIFLLQRRICCEDNEVSGWRWCIWWEGSRAVVVLVVMCALQMTANSGIWDISYENIFWSDHPPLGQPGANIDIAAHHYHPTQQQGFELLPPSR